MVKEELNVTGMTCHSCETLIKDELEEQAGIFSIIASSTNNKVIVDYDDSKISLDKIKKIIIEEGYVIK